MSLTLAKGDRTIAPAIQSQVPAVIGALAGGAEPRRDGYALGW